MTFDYKKAVNDFDSKVWSYPWMNQDILYDGEDDTLSDAVSHLESWLADAEVAEFELGMTEYNLKYPIQMPGGILNSDDETRAYVANVIVESSAKIEAYIPEAEKILAEFVAKHGQ